MTVYDAAMAGVVVLGMIWGAWRGLTWQVAGIASLVFGFLAARSASEGLASQFPGEPIVARALAMLFIYVLVSGGIFVAAWTIRATLRKLRFEAYDRHLGMVFGGLAGALLGLAVTLFVVSLSPESREPIFGSPSGRLVGHLMDSVGPALPGELRDVLTPFWGAEPGEAPALARRPADEPEGRSPAEDVSDALRDEFQGLRRSAGRAVGRAVESGSVGTDSIRDLYEEGKSRLGRAAGRVFDDPRLDLNLSPASASAPKGRPNATDPDARRR